MKDYSICFLLFKNCHKNIHNVYIMQLITLIWWTIETKWLYINSDDSFNLDLTHKLEWDMDVIYLHMSILTITIITCYILYNTLSIYIYMQGPSWSWLYCDWIYNYLGNQYNSSLTLWVRIPLMARCTRYIILWWSLSVTCDRSMVCTVYSGFLHL